MTREEAVALLERYSNYEGMGIPNLAGCKEAMKVAVDALKEAFPELAESEDERIRKRLIEYFKGFSMGNAEVKWEGLNVQEVLVWLEKQKECVSNNFDDVWDEEDCEEIIAEGQKLTPRFKELLKEVCHAWYDRGAKLEKQKEVKWSPSECEMGVLYKLCYVSNQITDEDDTELTRLYQDLKREYFNGHSFENMFPKEKQKEQKPAEWSEEDEDNLCRVIRVLEDNDSDWKELSNWLKPLRPQPKQEWSQEDEKDMAHIIRILDDCYVYGTHDLSKTDHENLVNKLKSLRPVSKESLQPHWKPSEEQMNALYNVINPCDHVDKKALESLYEQLKKLM